MRFNPSVGVSLSLFWPLLLLKGLRERLPTIRRAHFNPKSIFLLLIISFFGNKFPLWNHFRNHEGLDFWSVRGPKPNKRLLWSGGFKIRQLLFHKDPGPLILRVSLSPNSLKNSLSIFKILFVCLNCIKKVMTKAWKILKHQIWILSYFLQIITKFWP